MCLWTFRESVQKSLRELFVRLSQICAAADRPIVLLIDEVDSASNNRVLCGPILRRSPWESDASWGMYQAYLFYGDVIAGQNMVRAMICEIRSCRKITTQVASVIFYSSLLSYLVCQYIVVHHESIPDICYLFISDHESQVVIDLKCVCIVFIAGEPDLLKSPLFA